MRKLPTEEEISVMTRKEMKRYCRRYKLSTKGKNWVLRERLTRYVQENMPLDMKEIAEERPSPYDELSPFDKALMSYNSGEWEKSLELYDQSIEIWPGSDELWIGRGNAQYHLGRYKDSLHSYDRATELNRKSTLARRNKVNLLLEMGKLEEALAVCDELESLDCVSEWVWLRKAYLYILLGRDDEAHECLQKVLDWDDSLEEVWNMKGVLLMERDSEAALRCFNKALELRDDYAIAWCNKGSALTRLGLTDDAKRCYDKALMYDKRSEIWNCKGVLHMGLDENLEALACFGKAIELGSRNAEAWNNRGTVLKGMKRLGEALECFQNALSSSYEFEDASSSLEEVHKMLQYEGYEKETPIEDFLISIPGIGKKKARRIIEAGYNSMEALRKASLSSLSSIKGIGENLAETIKEFLS
ncbi:MAG: tetratricopeptide repeat protein [Thermoplasmata archaeon]